MHDFLQFQASQEQVEDLLSATASNRPDKAFLVVELGFRVQGLGCRIWVKVCGLGVYIRFRI